jgi:hypothetical protein
MMTGQYVDDDDVTRLDLSLPYFERYAFHRRLQWLNQDQH